MFEVNDLIICKPAEEKRNNSNKDFEIYARVVEVDREANKIRIDKYLKNGRLPSSLSEQYLPLDEIENKYYQPMNDEEILLFLDGLEVLPEYKKKPETHTTIECVQERAEEILAQKERENDYEH